MEKIAFLFPGQGSQFAGMGKALAAAHGSAMRVFEEADQALGFALSTLCFEGPEEDLKLTQNTQPALVAVSIAALAILRENGFAPNYVAGHSLGEYSALVAAGSLPFAGKNPHEVLRRIGEGRFPDPRTLNRLIGDGLSRIIRNALARNPDDR